MRSCQAGRSLSVSWGRIVCDSCDRCNVDCKMGAIDDTGMKTQAGECILCMKCQAICPTGAVRFTLKQPPEQDVPVNLTKRGFVTACISSVSCRASSIAELSKEEE